MTDQSSLFDTPSPLRSWQGGDRKSSAPLSQGGTTGESGTAFADTAPLERHGRSPRAPLSPAEDAQSVSEAAWRRDDASIQELFERFHSEHPEVYDLLVTFARQLKSRGHEHAGIGLIWERMRWESALGADRDVEPFKLNNDFRSRYSRLIAEREPDLADFFRTRELRAS